MNIADYDFAPGRGPVIRVRISLRAGNVQAVRDRVGARGFSAYVDTAVERQIERDLLEDALAAERNTAGSIP